MHHISARPTRALPGDTITPGKTLCGKYIDTLSAYLYPDQVEGFAGDVCEDCYNDPDYPLHVLADVGEEEKIDWDSFFRTGTQTGRFSSQHANLSNVASVMKSEMEKLRKEVMIIPSQFIVSPTDYAALELRMPIPIDDDDCAGE